VTTSAGTEVPREARDFGSYELVAKLATGGMAEIFLARRTDPVGRGDLVVIKRILPHLAEDDHFVTMFRDEAALASRLEHPNVCRVYTLGHTDKTWFIVMEYLHGVALSRMLTRLSRGRQQLDLRLVAGIIIQACEALHHAHELRAPDGHLLGVVHRDVSPPNIFVCADGVVKLLDFGIAKARGASSKTRTGTVKGKNAYMSPEQILGRPLDRRSDVFALGAVLYELLAVRRLFHRESDFLTFKAITEEPIPDIRDRRSDLPAALREIVHRALARDVRARYASARDLGDALAASVASLGGPASPAELAAMVASDFGDELAAKEELCQQAPAAPVGAQSTAVPVLAASASSSGHAAAAPTVVDGPRGNLLAAQEGELAVPDRPASEPRRAPSPPPPGMLVIAAPPAPPSGTGPLEPSLDTPVSLTLPLSTDLLAARRRSLVTKAAGAGAAALLLIVGILVVGRCGGRPAATPPPDAATAEVAPEPPPPRRGDAGPADGVTKDDIIAISRFGYFSISADEPTVIFIDDKRIGEAPLVKLPLPPGPHKVRAVGPRRKVKRFDITIFGGQDTDWGMIEW
jgi:eukaryotic-like serine/threonine-protein kinase